MRTTIMIDDEILEQLKVRAASEGTTVSRLIEDSVRLGAPSKGNLAAESPFELITFGESGRFTSMSADRISALIEEDDIARYGRHE
jgi:hypothetical protein